MSYPDFTMTLAIDLPPERNARAVSLLEMWEVEDATHDPAELEARRSDWEATKASLNESHGSNRELFPQQAATE